MQKNLLYLKHYNCYKGARPCVKRHFKERHAAFLSSLRRCEFALWLLWWPTYLQNCILDAYKIESSSAYKRFTSFKVNCYNYCYIILLSKDVICINYTLLKTHLKVPVTQKFWGKTRNLRQISIGDATLELRCECCALWEQNTNNTASQVLYLWSDKRSHVSSHAQERAKCADSQRETICRNLYHH
jgi:hypothetical protein